MLQITPVSSLDTHKRTECRAQNSYRACTRCGELIDRRFFHRHVGRKDCKRKSFKGSYPHWLEASLFIHSLYRNGIIDIEQFLPRVQLFFCNLHSSASPSLTFLGSPSFKSVCFVEILFLDINLCG